MGRVENSMLLSIHNGVQCFDCSYTLQAGAIPFTFIELGYNNVKSAIRLKMVRMYIAVHGHNKILDAKYVSAHGKVLVVQAARTAQVRIPGSVNSHEHPMLRYWCGADACCS
jgi:hypothetical protein